MKKYAAIKFKEWHEGLGLFLGTLILVLFSLVPCLIIPGYYSKNIHYFIQVVFILPGFSIAYGAFSWGNEREAGYESFLSFLPVKQHFLNRAKYLAFFIPFFILCLFIIAVDTIIGPQQTWQDIPLYNVIPVCIFLLFPYSFALSHWIKNVLLSIGLTLFTFIPTIFFLIFCSIVIGGVLFPSSPAYYYLPNHSNSVLLFIIFGCFFTFASIFQPQRNVKRILTSIVIRIVIFIFVYNLCAQLFPQGNISEIIHHRRFGSHYVDPLSHKDLRDNVSGKLLYLNPKYSQNLYEIRKDSRQAIGYTIPAISYYHYAMELSTAGDKLAFATWLPVGHLEDIVKHYFFATFSGFFKGHLTLLAARPFRVGSLWLWDVPRNKIDVLGFGDPVGWISGGRRLLFFDKFTQSFMIRDTLENRTSIVGLQAGPYYWDISGYNPVSDVLFFQKMNRQHRDIVGSDLFSNNLDCIWSDLYQYDVEADEFKLFSSVKKIPDTKKIFTIADGLDDYCISTSGLIFDQDGLSTALLQYPEKIINFRISEKSKHFAIHSLYKNRYRLRLLDAATLHEIFLCESDEYIACSFSPNNKYFIVHRKIIDQKNVEVIFVSLSTSKIFTTKTGCGKAYDYEMLISPRDKSCALKYEQQNKSNSIKIFNLNNFETKTHHFPGSVSGCNWYDDNVLVVKIFIREKEEIIKVSGNREPQRFWSGKNKILLCDVTTNEQVECSEYHVHPSWFLR